MDVPLRDVTIARDDETAWQGAGDVTHQKRTGGFWGNMKKVRELKTRRRTRRFEFWGSLRWDEFARHGCRTRWGPDDKDRIVRLCLSSICRNLLLKVNKKVSYLSKKSLRVFEFRDSYVLYTFYRYEYYMSISHVALIVAM